MKRTNKQPPDTKDFEDKTKNIITLPSAKVKSTTARLLPAPPAPPPRQQ